MPRIIEEDAVNAVISYLNENLPAMLAQTMLEHAAEPIQIALPMFVNIDDEYMDPQDAPRFPYASILVEDSKDIVQDRALDSNRCRVRVMSLYNGKHATKKTYRYNNAIRELIQQDRSLGGSNCRARVLERIYYTPIMRGNEEVRVAETYLEVTMEVQRR